MITLSKLEEGYRTFMMGRYEPDFMCASRETLKEIERLITAHAKSSGYEIPFAKIHHGRMGTIFNNAILILDSRMPEGIVRYENYSDPTNSHLNGEIKVS